jgi:hypothetical protein
MPGPDARAAALATIDAARVANTAFLAANPARPPPPATAAALAVAAGPEEPTGVPFPLFESLKKPARKIQTGVYVFAIDPADNSVHWAFGRKIPPERRVPLGWIRSPAGQNLKAYLKKNGLSSMPQALATFNPPLVGAAGTNDEYHGKWASLGGGSDKDAETILDAARIELNDEAALTPPLQQHEVYLPDKSRPFVKGRTRATLVGSDRLSPNGSVYVFVFKWEDFAEFKRLFPPVNEKTMVRGGPLMAKMSHGEIDYAQSFTPDEMLAFWTNSQAKGENFFTSYTMRSFQGVVMDIAEAHSVFLASTRGRPPLALKAAEFRALSVPPDRAPRRPTGWRDQFVYVT